MRVYLSSDGLGEFTQRLQAMVGDNKKMLCVVNARDDLDVTTREQHVSRNKAQFEAAGFEFYELDLRHYFNQPEKLAPIVANAGLVWVTGGNTFLLRRAMQYSGLDTMIENGLRQDAFVYGGSSAGSIVLTKTLRGTENGDDPFAVAVGYKEEIIWNGLGLIYPQIVPHYQSDWFGERAQAMVDYFETNGLVYQTLRDGDVYAVDGEYEATLTP